MTTFGMIVTVDSDHFTKVHTIHVVITIQIQCQIHITGVDHIQHGINIKDFGNFKETIAVFKSEK